MKTTPTAAFTHGGKFHADDVFSAALLQILFKEIEILRGFDVPAEFDGIVFDIGGGEFDHHGPGCPVRPSGTAYAAFGLLWRAYGAQLVGEQEADYFDRSFIEPLDADDNTGCGSELAAAIGSFNPGWDSKADATERFFEAVSFAKRILENRIELIHGDMRAKEIVKASFAKMKNGIAVLPQYAPWKREAKNCRRVQFVVYPSQRGGFAAQAVEYTENGEKKLKCPFPAAWAGLRDAEIAKVSGIKTLRFCHNSRFMVTAETQQDVLDACLAAKRLAPMRLAPAGGFDLKAVVCDCDGTIVDETLLQPAEATLYELQKAKENKAVVIIATGRILPVVPSSLRGVADYFVCGNGAVAADAKGNIIFKDDWTSEEVEEFSAFCQTANAALSLHFENGYAIYHGFDKFADFYRINLGSLAAVENDPTCSRHKKESACGAFYIGSDEKLAEYLANHPNMQAAALVKGYYDVYKKETCKAKMIQKVLEKAGVSWENTAVFGDGNNDVEMLQSAGLGCAMGNARAKAKEAAEIIAPPISENGVAQVLRALRTTQKEQTKV